MRREKVRMLGLQAQDAAARGDLAEAARVLDLALAEFDPRRAPKVTAALDRLHLLRAKTAVDAGQAFVLPDRWTLPLPVEPDPARAPRSGRRQRPRPRKGAGADAARVKPRARRSVSNGRDISLVPETSWEEPTSRQSRMQVPTRGGPAPVSRSVGDNKTARARGRRALRPADLPGLAGRWLGVRPPAKVETVVSAGAMETDRHRH